MPIPLNQRVDLSLIRNEGFEYKWEDIENDDLSQVDLTAVNVSLLLHDKSNPPILLLTINPALSKGSGFVSFGFSAGDTDIAGPYDYAIQDISDPLNPITFVHGVLTFVDPNLAIPWVDIMANEIPQTLVIPQSFINVDQAKWRAIFLSKPNSFLVNATQNDPSTWPMIYNFLIAKLVVFDFLEINLKRVIGSDLVKKITTGPSDVEFIDPEKLLKAYGGVNAVDALKADICELASTLTIYIGICGKRVIPFTPQIQGLPKCPSRFFIPILNRRYY